MLRKSSWAIRLGFGLFLTIACASLSWAQFTGTITGVVQDPSGAGVAKATVQLTSGETSVSRTTTSDSSGNYDFEAVAPGSYRAALECAGHLEGRIGHRGRFRYR